MEAEIKFNRKQAKLAKSNSIDDLEAYLQEAINELPHFVDKIVEDYDEIVAESMTNCAKSAATKMTKEIHKKYKSIAKSQDKYRQHAYDEVRRPWKSPLALMRVYLSFAYETWLNSLEAKDTEEPYDEPNKFEAITRIASRSIQISEEILLLLNHGYADGAQGRWRSLHELAVYSCFLSDNDDELSERYLNHEKIEYWKTVIKYNDHCEKFDGDPIPAADVDQAKEEAGTLLKLYGSSYKNERGWAAECLDEKNPTFKDIEEKSGLEHLRPDYTDSNNNIHAGALSIISRLGLYEDEHDFSLLSGPSYIGLSYPAQSMITSISQVVCSAITIIPSMDNIVAGNTLMALGDLAIDLFLSTELDITEDDGIA